MDLKIQQIQTHLKKNLLPVYLVSGDVPLLIQETTDAIRQAARKAGFTQREKLDADTGFNWSDFSALTQNFSLFSDKTLIEVRNPKAKFNKEASDLLVDYLKNPPADTILLLITDKLTGAQKKARWYKAIDNAGATIALWPVGARELPSWIGARLQQAQLKADANSIRLLAELSEGNLLSAQQAIEKLRLLYPDELITPEKVAEAIHDNARFNVFDLGDYALAGNAARVRRVIQGLHFTGTEPTLVLWVLAREIRNVFNLLQGLQQGAPLAQLLAHEWQNRKALLQQAVMRLKNKNLNQLLQQAERTDHLIKGVKQGDPWEALERLGLALAGDPSQFPSFTDV